MTCEVDCRSSMLEFIFIAVEMHGDGWNFSCFSKFVCLVNSFSPTAEATHISITLVYLS